MFDLQRNLLTTLLGLGIFVLGLVAVAAALLMGRPDVGRIAAAGPAQLEEVALQAPETGLEEYSAYMSILQRPMFFSDRRLPVVEAADETDESLLAEQDDEDDIQALDASVAGIIITPEMKLAMVADARAGRTLVLREGMPLEGEQAAWRLTHIETRQVRFESVDGREAELELAINTAGLDAPPPPARRSAAPGRDGQSGHEGDGQVSGQDRDAEPSTEHMPVVDPRDGQRTESGRQASEEARQRAEEIRRRVAERRAQLREDAERRARNEQQQRDRNG